MSRPDIDWGYLTHGLGLRLAACAVALAAFATTAWYRVDALGRSELGRQQLEALEQQRLELAGRVAARERYAQRFVELEAEGIVGEEQRLQWAQVLRDAAADLHLPYLRYTAAPRQPFDAPWLVAGTAAPVMVSTMELQAGLVHELDLLRLVERLQQDAPGLVSVTGCALERAAGDQAPAPDKANIAGTCQLHWYSIQLPGAAMAMETGE